MSSHLSLSCMTYYNDQPCNCCNNVLVGASVPCLQPLGTAVHSLVFQPLSEWPQTHTHRPHSSRKRHTTPYHIDNDSHPGILPPMDPPSPNGSPLVTYVTLSIASARRSIISYHRRKVAISGFPLQTLHHHGNQPQLYISVPIAGAVRPSPPLPLLSVVLTHPSLFRCRVC